MRVYTGHWSISSAVPVGGRVSGRAEFPVSGRADFPVSGESAGERNFQSAGERNFQSVSGRDSGSRIPIPASEGVVVR